MTRSLVLALLAGLVLAAPAHARQHPPWPHVPWPPLAHVVEVADTVGPCRVAPHDLPPQGCAITEPTAPDYGTAYVLDARYRFGVNHEVGHLFDVELLNDDDRARLMAIFHLSPPWSQGTGNGALRSPMEWAADLYARCRLHQSAQSRTQEISYTGSWPRARTLRVCAVFAAAAERAGLR